MSDREEFEIFMNEKHPRISLDRYSDPIGAAEFGRNFGDYRVPLVRYLWEFFTLWQADRESEGGESLSSVPNTWEIHSKLNIPAPNHKGQRIIGYRVTIPEGGWPDALDWLPNLTAPQINKWIPEAVQHDGLMACPDPDCARFYDHNAKRMACAAWADDACAMDHKPQQESE